MVEPHTTSNRCQTFEALTLTHFNTLYSVAVSLTRNADEARDLVQETYCKAYRFWHRFQAGTHVKAWLLTILRNTYINTYRKTTRRSLPHTFDTEAPVDADFTLIPEQANAASMDNLLRHVVQDEVKQAIDDLPETFRLPVMLADLADCSYQEIADVMGCPVGTVMSRLYRGRQLLRKRLRAFAQASGYIGARATHDANVTDFDQASESLHPIVDCT